MKKVLLILVASIFSFSTAIAEVMVTAGVSMNKSVFAAEGKERNYDYAGTIAKTTVEYGAFDDSYSSIFAEVGNGTIGIGVSYVPGSIDTPTNSNTQVQITNATSSTETVKASFDALTTLYAIARLPVYGLYVKAGMSKVDVDVTETNASANYGDTETDGITFGIGLEKDAGDTGVALRVEVMAHEFDDVNANNGKGAGTADANVIDVTEMIGATATISLVKNF
tara:strand:+ start:855 stop:1526 length:672 start_codon:yes stop_codon:yes gene_type:complete